MAVARKVGATLADQARVVVVGPVVPIAGGSVPPLTNDIERLYDVIAAATHQNDAGLNLPVETPELQNVPPLVFYQLTEQRLRAADAVVVVCRRAEKCRRELRRPWRRRW